MGKNCSASTKNCQCCQPVCIFSWIVIAIGIGATVNLIYDNCEIYRQITVETNDIVIYNLTLTAILYPTASALIFIILTKVQVASDKCCTLKVLWFLFHISFCMSAIVKNILGHIHTPDELMDVLNKGRLLSGTPEQLPLWFLRLQTIRDCCGVNSADNYGFDILPATLIETCNRQGNAPVQKGCMNELNDIYNSCRNISVGFVLIMMCAGCVPLVIYSVSYRNKLEADAKKKAERELQQKHQAELLALQAQYYNTGKYTNNKDLPSLHLGKYSDSTPTPPEDEEEEHENIVSHTK